MRDLEKKLQYQFQRPQLLTEALTHPSYGSDHGVPHYQRLEFLGDAVLQLAITQRLFDRFPEQDEGRLTRARAAVVCEESLFAAADRLNLGGFMRLSVGEERSGGRKKPSILSDAMEAVFGAIYLDGGIDAAFRVVYRVLEAQLGGDLMHEQTDYKTQLQIEMQKKLGINPTYELISTGGTPHLPVFTVRVLLGDRPLAEGVGQSKQAAQQAAAKSALAAQAPGKAEAPEPSHKKRS